MTKPDWPEPFTATDEEWSAFLGPNHWRNSTPEPTSGPESARDDTTGESLLIIAYAALVASSGLARALGRALTNAAKALQGRP